MGKPALATIDLAKAQVEQTSRKNTGEAVEEAALSINLLKVLGEEGNAELGGGVKLLACRRRKVSERADAVVVKPIDES